MCFNDFTFSILKLAILFHSFKRIVLIAVNVNKETNIKPDIKLLGQFLETNQCNNLSIRSIYLQQPLAPH